MDLAEIARRLELETLYTDYAACLDSDALERWPEFFTEDCHYRVTSAENYEAGLPLGLIYATSQNMLRDRVSALRDANIYEPQRYRHLISGIRIEREAAGMLDVTANFLVVRTMQDGGMSLWAGGAWWSGSDAPRAAGNSPARMSSSTAGRSTRCWPSRSETI